MDYIAQPKDYWIAQGAITITLNALGNPNRIQGSVASGAAILCYIEGVDGLGYDNGHRFKTWPLSLSPTYFNSNTQKYVYAAIPRTSSIGTQAVVVFPSEKLDVYGKNSDGAQVGSSDYYYIWLQGIISSSGEYGTTNRTWTEEMDFGKKGTDEDLYDDTDGEWYQYSKVSEIVTFLKNITMKAGTTFYNLYLGYKELTGVATATTGEEYVDSETLVATPSYIHANYLRKNVEDTAEEQIGFLKGIWIGIKGLYEITAEGVAKFKSLFADDITAQRMQVEDMQSSNYTGDGIADTGWRLTTDYNGHSKLTVDELYVRMKAVFESLEVKKELVSGGNQVQSCAASVISKVDYLNGNKEVIGYDEYKVPFTLRNAIMMLFKGQNPFGSYSRTRRVRLQLTAADRQNVRYVRCYFLAKEGDRKIQNWWRVADPNDNSTGNDMARCQTFNLASDSISERDTYFGTNTQKRGNIFWWRKLAGVSTIPVEIDGKQYHYFDVYCNPTAEAATRYSYSGAMEGSDIPAPGDEVSQWGNDNNIDRMNLIVQEVNGQDAAIKMYEGINQFSMETGLYGNPLKIRFAPKTGCKVHTTKWEVVTETFIAPIPVECGNWSDITPDSQGHRTCRYYEIYQHNGGSWLCVASNGGTFKVIEAFSTYAVGDTITQTAYDALTVNQQMCCARVSFGTTTDEPSTTSAAWRQYAAKGEKGDNGDNVIRMDLDNEYDSIQYQGDGTTKVSPSGTVQTTAYLFDGITDKSSDATFTISNRSGMSDQQATISGRVVTVSGLTSDGEVTIRAEYPANSGKYYYAKFTVKKLIGIDKYDLVVTPNAVPVNTSNTVADTAINVQVYRTPANGGTRHLVEFTNKTTNDYGLTLSVKDSLNNNLTETTGTGTVTTRTFNLTGTMATNADNVMVVLTKDSKTQDAETVPITHVHNGIDGSGSNAVKIDLDNEMDSIPCDSDGKVMSQTVLEVNARIYDGAAPVTSGVAVSSVGAIAGVSAVTSISNGVVNIKWTIPATGSGTPLSVDKYTSQIVLTWGGNSYYATFTANVVKSGEPGVSPTIFQLLPSPSQISFKRDSSGSIPSSTQTLSLSIKKSDENGTSVITVAASGLTVRYRTDQAPSSASDGTAWPAAGLSVSSSVTYGNVYIAAFDSNGTLVDRETVAIVKDGEKGANGSNAVKIDLDNEMDSIPCDSDGKVMSQTVLEVNARIYDGAAPVTSGVAVSSVGSIAGVGAVTSISNGVVNIKWTIPATGNGTPLSVDKYTSQIVLTWGGNSYYATFTANVVKSGEPGVSPTIFQLLPSPSQISFKRDSSGSIPSSTQTLSLSIKKSDENGTSVITVAASGLTVRYRTDQAPSSASDGTAWPAAGLSVSSSVTYGNVYIAAFDSNGTLVDRETVPIIKDGQNGAVGDTPVQAYQWNQSATTAPSPLPSGATLGNWSFIVPARPSTAGEHFLWMTQSVKHTALDGTVTYDTWQPATRVSGDTGDTGEDAVSIVISPASLIVNQDLQSPDNLSDLTQTFVVRVYKGDVEQTVGGLSFVAESVPNSSPVKYKCLFLNGGGQRSGNSNIAGNVLTLKQINTYTQDGKTLYYDSMYADVTATYNTNKTITARVRIYANLLGTWSETVEAGEKRIAAQKVSYALNNGDNTKTIDQSKATFNSVRNAAESYQEWARVDNTSVGSKTYINTHLATAEQNISTVKSEVESPNLLDYSEWYNTGEEAVNISSADYEITCDPSQGEDDVDVYSQLFYLEAGTYTFSAFFMDSEMTPTQENSVYVYTDNAPIEPGDGDSDMLTLHTTNEWDGVFIRCYGTFTLTGKKYVRINVYRDGDAVDFEKPMMHAGDTTSATALLPYNPNLKVAAESSIVQTAQNISLGVQTDIEGKLYNTGINIQGDNRTIDVLADHFNIHNSNNVRVMGVDSYGNMYIKGALQYDKVERYYTSDVDGETGCMFLFDDDISVAAFKNLPASTIILSGPIGGTSGTMAVLLPPPENMLGINIELVIPARADVSNTSHIYLAVGRKVLSTSGSGDYVPQVENYNSIFDMVNHEVPGTSKFWIAGETTADNYRTYIVVSVSNPSTQEVSGYDTLRLCAAYDENLTKSFWYVKSFTKY